MSTGFTRSGSEQDPNSLPIDDVFDVLSDEHRRHLIYYLADEPGGEARTEALVEYLRTTRRKDGVGGRGDIRLELHHQHLPKMEDAGVVDWEEDGDVVRYRGDALLEEILARVGSRDFDG